MPNYQNDGSDIRRPIELDADAMDEKQINILIKSFISPDDTDTGLTKEQYDVKERTTRKQITSGSLKVIFDESSDTTVLMSSQDWRKLQSN